MAAYGLDWTVRKLHVARKYMFYFYVIANLWIKKQLLFKYINKLFY